MRCEKNWDVFILIQKCCHQEPAAAKNEKEKKNNRFVTIFFGRHTIAKQLLQLSTTTTITTIYYIKQDRTAMKDWFLYIFSSLTFPPFFCWKIIYSSNASENSLLLPWQASYPLLIKIHFCFWEHPTFHHHESNVCRTTTYYFGQVP